MTINTAYALINEVIMHPSIMWNRQFFYSLNSMPLSEQNLMKEWFSEMNEKQKLYIYEIERANDQLKETAARLYHEKGFTRELSDNFLKKVSFMENRDYFRLKRKQVHGPATGSAEANNEQEGLKPKVSVRRTNFFDTMSSSCDQKPKPGFKGGRGGKKYGPRGPRPVTKV